MSRATAVQKRHKHHIDDLVTSIRSRHSSFDALAAKLRTPAIHAAFNKWDCNSWCVAVAGDALVRVRLFIEHNFNYIETMGLIAVARYMHELSVWLRLFKRDRRYGLVYCDQWITTQWNFYKDQKEQLLREVALLKSFEEISSESSHCALQRLKESPSDSTLVSNLTSVSQAVDMLASRRFSIYSKDAQTNGYGFQAYLIETQAIPHVEQALADLARGKEEFNRTVPRNIKELTPKRWQWRVMAQRVNLLDEYDFIYSLASKLLHATPVSITTDHKNLELSEMRVFLKYIDVKMDEVLLLAEEYCMGAAD